MPYATEPDLAARLGAALYARLTDREAGETADAVQGGELIRAAESLLDAHFTRRYRVPLDPAATPELADLLRTRTLDVAEHLAWRQSPFIGDMPARVQQLHGETLAWLQQVAAGRLDLPGHPPPSADAARIAHYTATPRRFTHDELDQI